MKHQPIQFICSDCGNRWGRMPDGHIATWNALPCDVCGQTEEAVTEPRDFGIYDTRGIRMHRRLPDIERFCPAPKPETPWRP